MQQLSGLDATFLYLETPEMPMHVGALHLYELPAGYKGKFVTAVRQHIRDRLPVRSCWCSVVLAASPTATARSQICRRPMRRRRAIVIRSVS